MRAAASAQRIAVAVLCGALILTACAERGDPAAVATTTTEPTRPVAGGTVRIGLGAPLQPDPAAGNLGSPSELMVLDVLHDGLTSLDDDGLAKPAVALDWSADAALTSWTFRLDPDASFSDGRAITGADVVASLERVAKGGVGSLAALTLERVAGFEAFAAGSAPRLDGLAAPDAATVTIALDGPVGLLPVVLATPVLGIVDVPSLEAAAASTEALAGLRLSGSWAVASAEGPVLNLIRRKGAPGHLAGLELRSYRRPTSAYDAFDRGQVDWAAVPSARLKEAVAEHGDDAFTPFHAELYFGIRIRGALTNLDLRRAIRAAIDRDEIVRRVYPQRADPLGTIIPFGVAGHDDGRCDECGHDVERARSLLAAAFPDGQVPAVSIDFDESSTQEDMAAMVAADLEAAGIPTEVRPKPREAYQSFLASGDQQLFSFGWIGGYGSPDAYLAPLFASASDDNLTGYASATVDGALSAARATQDAAVASAKWNEVERQVLAEVVVVPIAQLRALAVVGTRVRALTRNVDGTVDWSAVWVTDGR